MNGAISPAGDQTQRRLTHGGDHRAKSLTERVRRSLIGVGQQYDELVAAVAADPVTCPDAVSQHSGDRSEDPASVRVAETGVDALETVEFDQATGHGSAMTDAASDLAAKFPADRRISQTAGRAIESGREHPFRENRRWILLDSTSSTNR